MKWSKLSVPSISKDFLGLVVTLGFTVKVDEVVFTDKVVFVGLATIHINKSYVTNVKNPGRISQELIGHLILEEFDRQLNCWILRLAISILIEILEDLHKNFMVI